MRRKMRLFDKSIATFALLLLLFVCTQAALQEHKPPKSTQPSNPAAPPSWILDKGCSLGILDQAAWKSTKGGSLFKNDEKTCRPCDNISSTQPDRPENLQIIDNTYVKLTADIGCNARSTQGEPKVYINLPKEGDKPLEIEFWCMLQVPFNDHIDAAWAARHLWASIWLEGAAGWGKCADSGELDIVEWCCPGAPESNIHDASVCAFPNIDGWKQCKPEEWPESYNNLLHFYILWSSGNLKVYVGEKNTAKQDMVIVGQMDNWGTNKKTNWHSGMVMVMDIKRCYKDQKKVFENLPGLNLWLSDVRISNK